MSTRAEQYTAQVLHREQIAPHLVRLVLGGERLSAFRSTGTPDEWVGLVVPGQFQSLTTPCVPGREASWSSTSPSTMSGWSPSGR
ncbi:MAG: siderophore-interacting protein [Nocardioides sp.]|nr:siderophore-interacting protein [Nocardioides sp.]